MISRSKLEKTARKYNKLLDMGSAENLEEFIDSDAINSYDGRVKFVLKRVLSTEDYILFKSLCSRLFITKFKKKFQDRISVRFHMFSSFASDHIITIDGIDFYLVGNEEQFMHQFGKIREDKLSDLLDD